MPGFLNAELEVIRDNLECGHCNAKFKGSDSQARKVKYEKRVVYCSDACRHAALRNKFSTPIPNCGSCKTCGKEFFSRTAKIYCSMDCYMKSEQFREMQSQYWVLSDEMRAKISAKLKKGEDVPCLECGTEFYQKLATKSRPARKFCSTICYRAYLAAKLKKGEDVPCLECGTEFYQKLATKSRPARKFCSTICYRAYLAKRFDRWVANPDGMALPQCYDEFLDRDELRCVVDGCEWKGQHLTLHINQAHGVNSDEFKRATGFNLSTGVIAKPLAKALRERQLVGVAVLPNPAALELAYEAIKNNPISYISLEAREHRKKARAMLEPGAQRTCVGCGKWFQQRTPFGKTLYCSLECRDNTYAEQRKANKRQRVRQPDGT